MLKISKNEIDILVELQEIEIKTEIIKSEISKVSGKLDKVDSELKSFESEMAEEEKIINDSKQKYRSCETDVQVNNEKAQKSTEKLKLVKTNKEYQSSLKEIDEIKAISSKIEDEMLHYLEQIEIACDAPEPELLLVDWLNDLIYEMATRRMLFGRFRVTIEGDRLHGTAWGEVVDLARHHPVVEVKGATYTGLRVFEADNGGWTAECVIDV